MSGTGVKSPVVVLLLGLISTLPAQGPKPEQKRLRCVSTFGGGAYHRIYSVAVSPDGNRLTAGIQDEPMAMWDLASKRPVFEQEETGPIPVSLSFSRDGQLLAVGNSNGRVSIYDSATGRLIRHLCDFSGTRGA